MTTATAPQAEPRLVLGTLLVFQVLMLVMDRWSPGTPGQTVVRIGYYSCITLWLGFKIQRGYRRRQPHWTRESWLRYLRLATMPVGSIALFLFVNYIDVSPHLRGAPRSVQRTVWILIMLAMMLFGVIGLTMAIDWMDKGEPSVPFTRTRWFQRHPR